jgi:hypothetical protein
MLRTVHLVDRPDVDALRRHVDQQQAQTLPGRRAALGATQQQAEVRMPGHTAPDLLAVHHEVVAEAVTLGREAGPGPRLGEQLAPDLAPHPNRLEMPRALLIGAGIDQQRRDEVQGR